MIALVSGIKFIAAMIRGLKANLVTAINPFWGDTADGRVGYVIHHATVSTMFGDDFYVRRRNNRRAKLEERKFQYWASRHYGKWKWRTMRKNPEQLGLARDIYRNYFADIAG